MNKQTSSNIIPTGQFVYFGLPADRTVKNTMEKKLLHWIQTTTNFSHGSRPFCYISLQRDATEKVVTCFVEVQMGTKIWSAVDYGKNTLHAFLKCLPQLRPRSTIYDQTPEPPDTVLDPGGVAHPPPALSAS